MEQNNISPERDINDLPDQPEAGTVEVPKYLNTFHTTAELQRQAEEEKALKLKNEELENANEEANKLATLDQLTGLLNRHGLERQIEILREECKRNSNLEKCSLLLIDIDKFKSINDTYGHEGGDTVLKEITKFLKTKFRGVDIIARDGGEEFIIIFKGAGIEEMTNILSEGRSSTGLNFKSSIREDDVTVSGGLVSFNPMTDNFKEAKKSADELLYTAKGSGRNQILAEEKPVENKDEKYRAGNQTVENEEEATA